ncbi:MAG TPA: hypothetical protein VHG91_12745 [Longimicrobium sp.]|nr:hypothetical protein [Longimicrobium sp.]
MLDTVPSAAPAADAAEAVTPQEYRDAIPPNRGFRLLASTVDVELRADDPRRARYRYDCHLETLGDVPALYWYYNVPVDAAEIGEVRAWDAAGGLETRTAPGENGGTQVQVRLRAPVRTYDSYVFGFGYETVIRSVVADGWRSVTVSYSDWVIFNIACDELRVNVRLPPRAALVSTVPPAAPGGLVTYVHRGLRPLETVHYLVAYHRRHFGAVFYRWLAGAIGSGLIGALIAMGLQGR